MAILDALVPYLRNLRRSGQACWTAANCPACAMDGGRPSGDRLRIWPDSEQDGRGSWSCRRCGAHGDCVDLLMRLRPGLAFPMAWREVVGTEPPMKKKAELLGKGTWWTRLQRQRAEVRQASGRAEAERRARELEPAMQVALEQAASAVRIHRRAEAPAPRPLPPSEWRGAVGGVFREAREVLLSDPAAAVWLQSRGVVPEAAHAAGCFGWLPRDLWLDYAQCGMTPGAYGPRWPLPAGLLVVSFQRTFCGDELMAASVHCADRERWGKRRSAPGVAARATVLRPAGEGEPDAVLIMESAVDALLAWEASGRRMLCIGVGGAWAPDADADVAICEAADAGVPVVLVPDADDAGRRCADKYWHRRWPAAVFIEAIGGKDLTDADRAARNGVPGALRATAWMMRLRERLRGQTPASSRVVPLVERSSLKVSADDELGGPWR